MDSEPVKVTESIRVGGEKKPNDAKRVKLLFGIAAAALIAALLVSRLTGGGGGTTVDGLSASPTRTSPTTSSTIAAPTPHDPAGLRDPFAVPVGLGTSTAASTVGTATSTASTPTGTSATDISTTPTTVPAPSGTTPTTTASGGRVRLTLLEVDAGPAVNVRVDDQVVNGLAVNDTFLGSFRVVSLGVTAHCGVILYGDRRLYLCEGDEAVL